MARHFRAPAGAAGEEAGRASACLGDHILQISTPTRELGLLPVTQAFVLSSKLATWRLADASRRKLTCGSTSSKVPALRAPQTPPPSWPFCGLHL